ncbi:Pr6Pr family membrane protein [Roseobacteraceae bacterium S113]
MTAKRAAALIALAVLATLATRIYLNMAEGNSFGSALWTIYRFFTVWTNTAIGIVAAMIALGRPVSGSVQSALLLAIGAVSIVYHVLLAHLLHFEGMDKVVDIMFHTVVPILWLLYWLFYSPKAGLRVGMIPAWLGYPAVYCAYALVRGAFDGEYPYHFLDVHKHGYGGVAINSVGLLVAFTLSALLIVFVGRLLARMGRR